MTVTSIGVYQIERKVSVSGLSVVYAATDPRTGLRVAIKVAQSTATSEDHAAAVSHFRSESALLAAVKHSSIPVFHEEGILPDGSPYMVMEWVEGQTLETILKSQGRLSARTALLIARQVAGALGAAHASGYVHRDTKPSNIMVLDEGPPERWTVKLLDFGVGGTLLEHSQLTTANGIFGTVLYMSPEQLRGEGVSPRSDVWQLGVVLFEMLTGTLPYQRGATYTVMNAILNVPATIPAEAHLSPGIADFLLRCLAKDPALRPANGDEAMREVDRLLLSLPVIDAEKWPSSALGPPPPVSSGPTPKWVATTLVSPAPARGQPPAPAMQGTAKRLLSGSAGERIGWVVSVGLCVLLAVFLGFVLIHPPARLSPAGPASPSTQAVSSLHVWNPWSGVALGVGLALGGMVLGKVVRSIMTARFNAISQQAQMMLSGAHSREQFSEKLARQVDDIVAKCRLVDEKFMAMTLAVMVDEYGASTSSDERQKALMNAVSLLEKLMTKLSPWYVRNDKLIALVVTLVGVLSGLATVAQNVAKLVKGS